MDLGEPPVDIADTLAEAANVLEGVDITYGIPLGTAGLTNVQTAASILAGMRKPGPATQEEQAADLAAVTARPSIPGSAASPPSGSTHDITVSTPGIEDPDDLVAVSVFHC